MVKEKAFHLTALGPLLFLVYVNELPNCITQSSISMFADVTAIYCSGKNTSEIEKKFNIDFENISHWIASNGLALNVKKTEFIIIGTPQKLRYCDPIDLHLMQ